ncbi:hypothetical protein KR044_007416, partial [Drosophila immigrans]
FCVGLTEEDLLPHPFDCNAYFACSNLPKLYRCSPGLIFDANNSQCDLPERAVCRVIGAQPVSSTTSGYLEAAEKQSNMDLSWWEHKPQPVFLAVDVATGQSVSPMDKYDPKHVECRHFGAYFLPHPSNCQQYFICAYGHLHRHQCGLGTLWDYKSSECQLSPNAECYGRTSLQPEQQSEVAASSAPGQVTVCYIVSTSSSLASSLPSSSVSVSSSSETTLTTSVTAPSPPRAPQSTLICPSERQSYLPHAGDCSKYYICIAGMPVLTSCPRGLLWNQKMGYCDQTKNVKCFQN